MKWLKTTLMILGVALITSCHAVSKTPPTQVVYRFDDHRYLELRGFGCEGELTYVDSAMGIRSVVLEDFYRIFTAKYVHPSQRYIAITGFDAGVFLIPKDYGQTWEGARFSPGGGADPMGADSPEANEIDSFTVVNDQGFILTKKGDIYLSSKPFDDPRLQPGGSGIDYTRGDPRGQLQTNHLGEPGGSNVSRWGKDYVSWNSVNSPDPWIIFAYMANWQNIPNKVPEVKNYTGWDHMRCDPDLGLPASEQGK